jgi:hypothetical protein
MMAALSCATAIEQPTNANAPFQNEFMTSLPSKQNRLAEVALNEMNGHHTQSPLWRAMDELRSAQKRMIYSKSECQFGWKVVLRKVRITG